ncbi:MAG: glycosyltransferase family 1 protein [Chloroflexota bacterium]
MPTYVFDSRTATHHFPGIGRYTRNLAQAIPPLLSADERLCLILPEGFNLDFPKASNTTLITSRTTHFSLRQQWNIPSLLSTLHADLYHSPYYLMPYFLKYPLIVTLYDLIPMHFPRSVSLQTRVLFDMMHRWIIHRAEHIITPSEATRKDLSIQFNIPANNITFIPFGVEERFKPQPLESKRYLREKYNLLHPYALYLGSNKPHKNLPRLIEAWALLPRQVRSHFQLVVAGHWDPRYPIFLPQCTSEVGDTVRFLGSVPEADLPGLYAVAECLVFPSLGEGFGLPVLEAMACGVPVACSQIPALLEIAGEAALYFNPNDTQSMATTLVQLLEDENLRTETRLRGMRSASTFTWEKTAAKTLDLYQKIVFA